MNDYRRPAEYQIEHHYRCASCGAEDTVAGCYGAPESCHQCGGSMQFSGESYPANSEEWDEERDTQDGEWRRR